MPQAPTVQENKNVCARPSAQRALLCLRGIGGFGLSFGRPLTIALIRAPFFGVGYFTRNFEPTKKGRRVPLPYQGLVVAASLHGQGLHWCRRREDASGLSRRWRREGKRKFAG